jgi:hypothetical protein
MDDGEVTDVYDGVCEINDMINCYVSLKEETFNEVIVVNEPNTGESNNYDSSNPGSNPGNSGDNSGSPDGHGTCYEEWKCTEWTECSNGFRIRSCSDLSLCNTENFKPDLEEPCEAEEETEEGNLITGAVVGASGGSWGAIIAGLVVLVVGIAGSLVYFRRNSFSY